MKKIFLYVLSGWIGVVSSCSEFESVNTNPEAPEKVTSAMIATRIILNLSNQPTQKSFMQPYMLSKYLAWSELVEAYQYNGFSTSALDFTAINDAHFMVEFATGEGLAKSYEGLMHFARAVKFFEATMNLGDIPYHDALKGETDKQYFPRYDTQKEVFIGILNELDLAEKAFADGENFAGDPVYNGNTDKWRQLVNSFTLNVLMHLSHKESDNDLHIKDRFQAILDNKPIFTSNDDNYQLIRSDRNGQQYPFYKVGNNYTIYAAMSTEIIDRLKEREDRRLFYYAKPSAKKTEAGYTQADFEAYVGIDPSLPFDNVVTIRNSGDFSDINDRYKELAEGEPTQQLSYAQVCFIVAEAAARRWINESPLEWYKKGVEASMQFIYDHTPDAAQFHHNMPLDNTYVSGYVNTLDTSFPSSPEQQIEEIITQKYLSSFLQSEFATYYDYRRTGYPAWKINAASSLNSEDPTKVPVRWRYPSNEFNYNADNVSEAVERQFGGVDGINKLMWLLQ